MIAGVFLVVIASLSLSRGLRPAPTSVPSYPLTLMPPTTKAATPPPLASSSVPSSSPISSLPLVSPTPPLPSPSRTVPPPALGAVQEHYWLARPVGESGVNQVERYYPYGSIGVGELRIHHGVDIPNPEGVPVRAVARGKVIVAGDDHQVAYDLERDFYGQLVVLELERQFQGQKVFALYAHLSQVEVEVGQAVEAGNLLGKVGMTGVADGPHLHFEVRVGQNSYWHTRNPELWFAPLPGQGVIAGRVIDSGGRHIPDVYITFQPASSPEEFWRETYTYPASEVNSDEEWRENFVMGDVPAGSYILWFRKGEEMTSREIEVAAGQTVFLEVVF